VAVILREHSFLKLAVRYVLLRKAMLSVPAQLIMRVDDFPRWDLHLDEFRKFHKIVSDFNIPYVLGVTPLLANNPLDPESSEIRSLTDQEIELLHMIIKDGCDIALHGLTHRTEAGLGFMSEFCGISTDEAEFRIAKGIDLLVSAGLPRPRCFIPPFNTFDPSVFPLLMRYFDIILGGPESIWHSPGTKWVSDAPESFKCCLSPLYGKSGFMLDKLLELRKNWFVGNWVTFHWSWEWETGYRDLKMLLRLIAKKIKNTEKCLYEG